MNSGRVLVETLGGGSEDAEWTVLAVDGRPVRWRSILRVLPIGVQPLLVQAYRRRARVAARLPARVFGEPGADPTVEVVVAVTPVLGPRDRVHAIQVCYASGGDAMPLPYIVAAVDYSSDERSIYLAANPFGWRLPDGRSSWTVPEAFRFVERFDEAMDLILRTLDPVERLSWAGDLTVRAGDAARRYRLVLRGGAGGERTQLRGLLLDVTESLAPEPASVDYATLAALGRRHADHSYLALADVHKLRIIRWITDPVPGIQWKGTVDQRDTAHPDDLACVRGELERVLREGLSRNVIENIRMRRIGGGWTVIDVVSTMVPGSQPPVLLLIEMTVVGHTDDPDPTEPDLVDG
ncbi:GAF domain-containing protein [Nocardia alni]|uniref:GAF domain-containing protein n=1 Tax=Nocardia alni TaxID=2815723 RepID=UPI001C24DEC2|nr:GAF domain-containing protein [Nocardia alni]